MPGLRFPCGSWKRREAIAFLELVSVQAVPILQKALQRDQQNPYFKAALLFCQATEQQRPQLVQDQKGANAELEKVLEAVTGYEANYGTTPLSFPKLPSNLRLPSQLPVVFKAIK